MKKYKTTEAQRNVVLKRYYEKQGDNSLYKTSAKYYKDFTTEEDKVIMDDSDGLTMLDKARKLGRSYASIKGRRQRLLSKESGDYTLTWRKLHA